MLAHESEYTEVTGLTRSGSYQRAQSGLIALPARLLVPASIRGRTRWRNREPLYTQLFLREMSRRFARACFQSIPPWLEDGLALFFETLRVHEHEIVIGIPPFRIGSRWGMPFVSDGISIAQVARQTLVAPSRFVHDQNDPSAWAFVHMLELGPDAALRQRFRDGLTAMHEREPSWLSHGDASLDAPFERYTASTRLLERRIAYDPPPLPEPSAMSMSRGEAALVLAALELSRADIDRGRANAYLALAREDPATVGRAELMRLQLGELHAGETQGSVVDALVAAYPNDRDVLVARARRVLAGDSEGTRASVALAALAARTDLETGDLVVEATLAMALQRWDVALTAATEAAWRDPLDAKAAGALRDATTHTRRPLEEHSEQVVAARLVRSPVPFEPKPHDAHRPAHARPGAH